MRKKVVGLLGTTFVLRRWCVNTLVLASLSFWSATGVFAQIFVNKSFTPANVVVGQPTTLNITILNNAITPATSVAVTDSFPASPAGLKVAAGGLISNSCGGSVTATPGATSVTLSGGTVAASVAGVAGSCLISVQVVATPASTPESIVNAIPAGNISSNAGAGAVGTSATLAVSAASPITGNKVFAPGVLQGAGAVSRMTITLNNPNSFPLTGAAFTDSFPAQMQAASVPAIANSCGGTVTAAALATSLTLSGGTIPANGSCTIEVNMVARNSSSSAANGTFTNSIAINGVNTTETIRNAAAIAGSVTVQKAAAVTKVFNPAGIFTGGTSTLTLTLTNFNATPISGIIFTDTMPAGVTVAGGTSTTCGGSVTSSSTTLGVSGGSISAATAGSPASCTITATVTAPAAGTFVNSVPAGTIGGVAHSSGTATLTVTNGASITKVFSPSTIAPGGTSQLVVTVRNISGAAISGFSVTDNLPTGLTTTGGAATTCTPGTVSTTSGSVKLNSGSIAAGTSASPRTCTFRVNVTGTLPKAYGNTILAGSLSGVPYSSTSATLVIRAVGVSKAFNPTSLPRSGTSMLTLTLVNASTASAAAITSISDQLTTMGAGFTVAPSPSATTTCGGIVTATPGATSFSMTGGSIPIAPSLTTTGACTISVPVIVGTAAPIATSTNTIPVGDLVTSIGSNTAPATATLTVTTGVTATKAFAPAAVGGGGTTRLTITITRPANAGVFTNLVVTDPLPAGFVVAAVPNPATTCGPGVVNATPGAISAGLASGTLGSAGAIGSVATCTVSFDVKAPMTLGSYSNTIPIGNIVATYAAGTIANTAAVTAPIQVVSSITVNKAFSPVNITPLGTSRLTIFLANNAASAQNLTNVSFNDALPNGLVLETIPNAAFTTISGTCTATVSAVAGSSSLSISNGTITAGSSCELAADVTTGAIGALTNQVNPGNLTSAQGITNTNTTAATLVSSGTSDISITKTNNVTQQTAGTSTTYTIVVTNNSASIAVVGVPVNDNVPAGLTFSNWTCAASLGSICGAASGSGAIVTTVSLAKLGTATFVVTADLDAGFIDATVSNTASINPAAAGISDTDASNDQAIDTDSVVQSANLSIVKTVSNASPIVGEQVTFTVSVNNAGPSQANGVSVNDVLPAGYSFVSATPSVGGFTAPMWTIGTLAANGAATLQIIAVVNPTGPYVNSATVSSSTIDPTPANNTSSIGTAPLTAQITIAKTVAAPTSASGVNPAIMDAGDTVLYNFIVTNTGTATLNNVQPVDPGPLFAGQVGTGAMGGFVPGFAILAPGASQIFTATYTLSDIDVYRAAGVSGGVANTANASALTPSGSTITAVTSASASTTIVAQPSLSIVKTFVLNDLPGGTSGAADLGETILYTYTTTNRGNTAMSSVNISDNHETSSPVLTAAQIQGETLTLDGPLSLLAVPIVSTDAANNGFWDQLQPGATVVFTYLHTVTQAEVDGS